MAVQNPGDVSAAELTKLVYEREQGSAFQLFDTLFGEWDNGNVFEYDFDAFDIKRALKKDGKMGAIEQALTLPILSAPWKIVPAPNSGAAGQAIATEIDTFLRMGSLEGGMQTPFQQVIAQATSARAFKKAFFEKVYKTVDGKVWYDKIAFRPPETCRVARDPKTGAYKGYRQTPVRQGAIPMPDSSDVDILPPYAWVHINMQRRNPLSGESDLQVALWCHETKMKIMYLWTTFLATQAEPRITTTGADPDGAAKKIATLKGGGIVGLPTNTTASVLESNGTAAQVFQNMINYLDTQMSSSVLANFTDLATGATGSGSYALSSDQSSFFIQSLEAYSSELAESITHNIIGDLVVYNHGRQAPFPTFEFGPLEDADLDKCIGLINGLAIATNNVLPFEFVDELAMKASQYLQLDVDKIRAAMDGAGKLAEQKATLSVQAQQQGLAGQKAAVDQGVAGNQPGKPVAPQVASVAAKVGVVAAAVKAKQDEAQK
jgi:hypothetical protein